MNRHRAYWSVMGVEADGEVRRKRTKHLRDTLKALIDEFGFDDVVTEFRKMYEDSKKGSKQL